MKTIIGLSQFFHQNEPKFAALIGNLALILAVLASVPTVLQSEAGVTTIPPFLLSVSHYAMIGGIVIKTFSKLFGTVDASGNPVNTTLPKA